MTKIGLVQTTSYKSNAIGIREVSKILEKVGNAGAEIVCLPEQWLPNNVISDFDTEFSDFKEIAKRYKMTIIPGAFYHKSKKSLSIVSPIIGSKGEIIGKQEKIHPFDYERDEVMPGKEAKVFKSGCKFGVVICYDMVFPDVVNKMTKKGAQVILSPSRIVKKGIEPWSMYVQVRALENRIPIFAANVENKRFGGESLIVDLVQNDKVINPKITRLKGQSFKVKDFDLKKHEKSRKKRFSDKNSFR